MSVLLGNTWRVSVLGVVLSLVVLPSSAGDQAPKQSTRHVPVVEELVQLLQARPDLRAALEAAIRTADLKGIENSQAFLDHLNDLVTAIPTHSETPPEVLKVYYIINQAPDDRLNRDESFNAWMKNGSLQIIDGDTYQYNQERGLIVIDSPEVGLVAVLRPKTASAGRTGFGLEG